MVIRTSIAIGSLNANCDSAAKKLAERLQLPLVSLETEDYSALLVMTDTHLELRLTDNDAPGPVYVDFLGGALAHRRRFGGGRGQMLARAVGLKNKPFLTVIDISAGLGKDAFVLASLNCDVTMVERNPIIVALLRDGLMRAEQVDWFRQLKLRLIEDDAKNYLTHLQLLPDVIYFDPMYPARTKSALVKKEMRILRHIVGADEDAAELLALALKKAQYRVVVKRARHAPIIAGPKPDLVYAGKSSRFDVYLTHAAI
jgi:16S rRNA (guanine1516-N2)-methyltransferase